MAAMGVYESWIREGLTGMSLRTAVAMFLLGHAGMAGLHLHVTASGHKALREGETVEEARARALAGRNSPPGWRFVLAPEPLAFEEWMKRHSPDNPDSVQNPC